MAGKYFSVPGSPWNTKLPADAPISPNSAAYVADLQRMRNTGSVWWINRDSFTTAVYEVTNAQPKLPVYLIPTTAPYTPYTPGHTDRFTELAYRLQTVGVPIPPEAIASPGSDSQMTVINTDTGELWEMWVLEYNRSDRNAVLANNWSCMYGGWMPDHRINIGQFQDSDFPGRTYAAWGATATSLPLLAGLMLIDDLIAGVLPYALEFVPPDPRETFVWPAQRSDGYFGKTIPEGTIFRINPAVNVQNYSCGADAQSNKMLRMIAKAMQDYGLIINDKTGAGSSLSLRMQGGPNRLSVSWGSVAWDTMLAAIPLTDFQVVDPSYRPPVAAPAGPPPSGGATGPYWGARLG